MTHFVTREVLAQQREFAAPSGWSTSFVEDLAYTVEQLYARMDTYEDVRRELREWGPDGRSWSALVQANQQLGQQIAAVLEEISHAEANGHRLGDCQGVGPGEVVPAVRIDYLQAALGVEA